MDFPNNRVQLDLTTSVLDISEVYTSKSQDCKEYRSIRIMARSDEASAANGLDVQQSVDGVNWDKSDKFLLVADTTLDEEVSLFGNFVRVVFTNGLTAQTEFRMSMSIVA